MLPHEASVVGRIKPLVECLCLVFVDNDKLNSSRKLGRDVWL